MQSVYPIEERHSSENVVWLPIKNYIVSESGWDSADAGHPPGSFLRAPPLKGVDQTDQHLTRHHGRHHGRYHDGAGR